MLRGGAVSLALPWLESWSTSGLKAAEALPAKRLLVVSFPDGCEDRFRPLTTGSGKAWAPSAILAPFLPFKQRMSVLSGVENFSPIQADVVSAASGTIPRLAGMFLTCTNFDKLSQQNKAPSNGISMDQLVAQSVGHAKKLDSLVVSLSTMKSYCDGRDCRYSRNISWSSESTVAPCLADPQLVWDRMFSGASSSGSVAGLDKSVLDALLESSEATRSRLGQGDRHRLDEYLTSVRDLEKRVQAGGCVGPTRPPALPVGEINQNTDSYNRAAHAALMSDLIALAFQCDMTRVVSFMLDDMRSEFLYSHVRKRVFSATDSKPDPSGETCGNFHGSTLMGDANDYWASIQWWFASTTAALCQRLADMPEGNSTVLDNTVVLFGSSVHKTSYADNLPLVLLGGTGVLKQDQHVVPNDGSTACALRDVHFTLMNSCFGMNLKSFGESVLTTSNRIVPELLA